MRIERRSVNDPHESLHTTTASVARYASVRFCLTGAGPVWTACCFLIVTTPIGRVVLPEGRRLAGIAFGPGARKDLEFTEATFQCACLTPRRRVGSPSCLAKGIPPLCPVGLDVAHRRGSPKAVRFPPLDVVTATATCLAFCPRLACIVTFCTHVCTRMCRVTDQEWVTSRDRAYRPPFHRLSPTADGREDASLGK